MGLFADILGTLSTTFQIGKGGVKLKNNGVTLEVKAVNGTTDAALTASKVSISGDVIELNSDAADSAADRKYTIQRPASGMGGAVTLTLPPDDGSASQVLQTDGNGVLTWASAGTTLDLTHVDTTSFTHGDASPVAMFTLPANAVIEKIAVVIDEAFDGTTPTMSVGVAATPAKFMATTQVDLKGVAGTVYECYPGLAAEGTTNVMIVTLVPDSSSTGEARVLVYYSTPS
jgi:hypothetical protein